MRVTDCIGCGFCCRKTLCWLGKKAGSSDVCMYLRWNGERWRCKLIELDPVHYKNLFAGEGCCSSLNSYQVYKRTPSPDDLVDENRFLREIQKGEPNG